MGAAPGWYAIPNEPGTMRYWDGTAWTQHVQPLPPAADARPIAVGAPDDVPAASPQGGTGQWGGTSPQGGTGEWGGTAQPTGVLQPGTLGLPSGTQIPQAVVGVLGELGQLAGALQHQASRPTSTTVPQQHTPTLDELGATWAERARQYAASPQGRATGTAVAGGALLADGVIGFGGKRSGIGGAVGGMIFGLVFIALSLLVLKPLILDQATVHAGEATIQGTVIDQHASTGEHGRMCSPEASFVVDGQSYAASGTGSSSTCPPLGSHLKVIYRTADPADARVAPDSMSRTMAWIFPAAGALVFVMSLWTFVVRAGEISVGGVLLFKGLRARRAAKGL